MTTLLRIDASARSSRSETRALADRFINQWLSAEPDAKIVARDLGAEPPSFVSEDWIAAAFCDPAQRTRRQRELLALSDRLIDEVEQADLIVLATPMYNYGMPAALKAWVDQVVRIGRTFTFDLARGDRPLEPTLGGKSLVLLTSSGEFGFGPGELNAGADHLGPHVGTVAKYLGVERTDRIAIEYQEFGDRRFAESRARAHATIPALVSRLCGARLGAAG